MSREQAYLALLEPHPDIIVGLMPLKMDLNISSSNGIKRDRVSPIELLPPEIKVDIFSLCDIKTIYNVALTGPMLHRFVRGNEERLSRNILCREISPGLRCLAAACYKVEYNGFPVIRGKEYGSEQTNLTRIFLSSGLLDDQVFEARNSDGFYSSFPCTLEKAHKVLSFHSTVCYFATTLAGQAVKKGRSPIKPFTNEIPSAPPYVTQVSSRELHRFIKALYIFDLASVILPCGEAAGDMRDLWDNFWDHFSPWEQQQVRCVQRMLQDWINDRVILQRGARFKHRGERILGQFVIHKGLARLRACETEISTTQDPVTEFANALFFNTSPLKEIVWMPGMDEFWLGEDEDTVTLDTIDLLSRYEEEDSGPQDAWLHTLLENRIDDPIFYEGHFTQFECEACMTVWGFVFWDRAKLDWYSQNDMPTTDEMLDAAEDTLMSRENFRQSAWGRTGGYCTGWPWSS
ncbi:hypothetical protein F4781DRAFT_440703 [Annulohypoxylon bovei var. microspora]|nr:hypothetical protein F4781DRAFT_440703 [Annulohypoxylon bovei var. microspora]